jgi:MFS family permease
MRCPQSSAGLPIALGALRVILAGIALLLTACAVTGRAGHDSTRLAIGLMALGIGWSSTMIAGSTLLSESVPLHVRTSAQGLSDLITGLAGAVAGAVSGVIVEGWGFSTLTLIAALATIPFIVMATWRTRFFAGNPER